MALPIAAQYGHRTGVTAVGDVEQLRLALVMTSGALRSLSHRALCAGACQISV